MITLTPSGSNDTLAIQEALDTGSHVILSEGTFNVTNTLTFRNRGQILSGQGQRSTKIRITPEFNMSAKGVFVFTDVAMELRDLWVAFDQPDTSNRADLINYPVAIYSVDKGFTLNNCSITNAMNGIDMTGNCGQTSINLLNMSAYNTGIMIDGALDTIRIDSYHFWPFEMSSNQQSIFATAPTKAFSIGRVDGLFISKFLNISNLGMDIHQGSTGAPWVYLTECGFDTFNAIEISAGTLQVDNSYITLAATPSLLGVMQTGGFVQFSNCLFASSQNQAFMLVQNMTGGSLQINNCCFNATNCTQVVVVGGNTAGNSVQINNCQFQGQVPTFQMISVTPATINNYIHCTNNIIKTQPNVSYESPIIDIMTGNRVYLSGNRLMDKGSGSSTFIRIETDDFNWVSGNIAPGWKYSFPSISSWWKRFFSSIGKTGFYSNNL